MAPFPASFHFLSFYYLDFRWNLVGRLPAVSPAEARLGAVAMICLAAMALGTGAAVYATGESRMALLFVMLGAVGAWQASHYWRHK